MRRVLAQLALAALAVALPGIARGDAGRPVPGAVATGPAQARPAPGSPLLGALAVPPGDRARLAAAIARERALNPAAFAALRALERSLGSIPAGRDGRLDVRAALRPLGHAAVLPVLERLALAGPEGEALDDPRREALATALLEAVGALRDERARPVLAAVVARAGGRLEEVRAAAGGLARLGADTDLELVARLARSGGARGRAGVEALGALRRPATIRTLEALLAEAGSEDDARAVVRAAGDAGNAWAWLTPALAGSGEGGRTRAAARALVERAARTWPGLAREAAKSARVIDG
ncbi:MAG: hypothetical protein IT376_21155 [Polyangiaceae bacterium]|nr:hypothetical protein [Polyangiaceae bacterium]